MKEIWEDYIFPWLITFTALAVIVISAVMFSRECNELRNKNIEAECFNFYKENNYMLEKCSVFEDKFKKVIKND